MPFVIAQIKGVTIYDDFAHHSTAIKLTLDGLRKQVKDQRIIAVVELCSNTMHRGGIHKDTLAQSLVQADRAFSIKVKIWTGRDISELQSQGDNIKLLQLLLAFNNEAAQGGHFLLMSNSGFSGLYEKLIDQLQ